MEKCASRKRSKKGMEKIDFNDKYKTNVIHPDNTSNEFATFLEDR